MRKEPKRPRDANQLAKLIVDIATGEVADPSKEERALSAAKRKGALARKKSLTPAQRSDIASLAAQARWKKSDSN